MELFYKVLAVIIGPVVGIIVYVIIEGKRNAKTKAIAANEAETMLDDISYMGHQGQACVFSPCRLCPRLIPLSS